MRSRFAANKFADWRQIFNRLAGFDVIPKAGRERRSSHYPPCLHTRSVIVDPNVGIPALPLLWTERALPFLEPRILEEFEGTENEPQPPPPTSSVPPSPI